MRKTPYRRTALGLLFAGWLLTGTAWATQVSSPREGPSSPVTPSANMPELLNRLKQPAEPVSREGAGKIVVSGPGERYAFSFRLLARGPDAFRLELYDFLGRPVFYLFSLEGKTVFLAPGEKEGRPLNPFSGPLADLTAFPAQDLPLFLWGRVPLPAYDDLEWRNVAEKGKKGIVLSLHGAVQVELRLTPEPFVLSQARFSWSETKAVEVIFSGFIPFSDDKTPQEVEIKDLGGGYVLSLRYEHLLPRNEFPTETFLPPSLK